MFKLLKFLKGYRFKTVVGPVFKLVEAVFELITPLVVANIIDVAIPLGREGDFSALVRGCVIMICLGVFGLAFALTAQFFASRASLGFGTNLRKEMYSHINRLSMRELDCFTPSSLVTRLTSDVNQTQQAIAMFIRLVTRAPFIAVGAAVMAMIIDVKLSLIFIGAGIIIALVLYFIMTGTMPKYKKAQDKLDKVTTLTRESVGGARVVRAFGAEAGEEKRFNSASDSLRQASERAGALSALLNPLTYAIVNVGIILLLQFGGMQVYYGSLTQGEIIALVNYLLQVLNALIVFANLIVTFTKASASAARINEVLDVSPSLVEGVGAEKKDSETAIEMSNVNFSYNAGKRTLEDIDFSVTRGQSIGILGGTGSGKSTLISLMARLYDADEGTVKLFGTDIRDYNFGQIRDMIAVVPQKAVLFEGTVRDNMRFGKADAADEEILAALSIAQANFIDREGLDRHVTAGGANFSGGQRQRLCIARSLICGSEILVLDDSSSALDYATERALRNGLKTLVANNGMTLVTVTQRVSGIKNCDLIIVMEEGRIAAKGTHEELMANSELYRDICASQLKGEEAKG